MIVVGFGSRDVIPVGELGNGGGGGLAIGVDVLFDPVFSYLLPLEGAGEAIKGSLA